MDRFSPLRIFVTGATGVLGRPTVKRLVEAGHRVHALARSDRNEALLRQLGVGFVRGDLFDRRTLDAAISGCDAALHLATKIPSLKESMRHGAWGENDRIRSDGTKLLVDASLAAGVRVFVYPSVCFMYADYGAEWIDVDAPGDAPRLMQSTLTAEAEVERFTNAGRRGIVLRMGAFYSTTAPNTLDAVAMARRGLALLVGTSDAFWSSIWVVDAAEAVVAAMLRAPAGTFNVVDDEPLSRGEILDLMARAVGRRRLLTLPTWLFRLLAGKDAEFATRSQRVSNRRFKEATGWNPTVRSAREGWAQIASSLAAPNGNAN